MSSCSTIAFALLGPRGTQSPPTSVCSLPSDFFSALRRQRSRTSKPTLFTTFAGKVKCRIGGVRLVGRGPARGNIANGLGELDGIAGAFGLFGHPRSVPRSRELAKRRSRAAEIKLTHYPKKGVLDLDDFVMMLQQIAITHRETGDPNNLADAIHAISEHLAGSGRDF